MYEVLIPAIIGCVSYAARYANRSLKAFILSVMTGLPLAYFVSPLFVWASNKHLGFPLSISAASFLLAYFGPVLVDKAILLIRSYRAL